MREFFNHMGKLMKELAGRWKIITLSILMIILIFLVSIHASTFSSQVTPSTLESGTTEQLNFTVNNTDSQLNITEVNITLPSGFSFISESNQTSAAHTSFYTVSPNLTWTNTTPSGFIQNGTEEYFLFNVSVPSGTGTYNFTITVKFTDNSVNSTNITITVCDTIPPANIIPSPPTPANNSVINADYFEINITFTEVNPDTCILELNNGTQANYTMTMLGNYACYFNATNQSEGIHYYSVYINDTSGNTGWNGTWYVTIDTTQPTVIIFSPQNTTYATTSIDLNYTVQDANLDSCWYSLNGGSNIILASCSNITITASEGLNNVIVYANDSAGNVGSAQVYFTVDTTPPILDFVAPTLNNQSYTNTDWIYINVSANEQLDSCILDWNGVNETMTVAETYCYINKTGLSDGSYYFRIYGNDTVGNLNVTEDREIIVDTTPPTITIFSPQNTTYNTTTLWLNFTCTEANLDTCWYQYNGTNTSLPSCSNQTFTALNNQQSTLILWMNDTAGNINHASITFTVDTIQPSVTLISPSNASTWTSSSTVTFTYNVTDASSIASCTLLINGITDQTDTSITKDTSQTFTKSLSNGNYNWSVRCTDAGGNTGISSVYYLTVSYTPPESSITYETGGADYTPQEILPYVAYSWSRVNPGNVSIFKLNKKEIGIHEIGIMVINPATSVYIKVTKLKGKPADVTHEVSGKVYQYIEITHRNLRNNLEKAIIKFHVNKSWIEENNINKSTVSLYRYTTSWQKLPTTLISEDSKTVYYQAESTGFSYFAIAGEEVQAPEEVCNINGVCEEGETPENCPEDCKQPEEQPLQQICTPGEKRCLGQELQQCNQEGTSWETVEICQYGCSEGKCKSPDYTWIWYLIIAILVTGAVAIYMFKIRAIQ